MDNCSECVIDRTTGARDKAAWLPFINELCTIYGRSCDIASRALQRHIEFAGFLKRLKNQSLTADERRLVWEIYNEKDATVEKIDAALDRGDAPKKPPPPIQASEDFKKSLHGFDRSQLHWSEEWSDWHSRLAQVLQRVDSSQVDKAFDLFCAGEPPKRILALLAQLSKLDAAKGATRTSDNKPG